MPSEAQARTTINKLLEEAGWRFLPDEQGQRENIVCEHRVTRSVFSPSQDLGKNFEYAPNGFVDYVLLNTDQRAVAVVEAKKESIDPLSAKEQARSYAESLGVSHIFLSNGLVHYYWNLRQGNPVKVSRFLPLDLLGKAAEWVPDAARLAAVTVDENYIALSQDAAWLSYSPAERAAVMVNKKIRLLRDYQIWAIHELQRVASPMLHRFLFEMATGTGKTLLSAAIAKLYLRTGNATRILFLVDRLELEHQAWKTFQAYLGPDGIQTVIYKQRRRDWMQAQVVVTTIQSLATRNRFLHEFAPTDFQLIISDEADRTISGNNRAIFEYFVGAKLGLTATPRDYLKGVNEGEQQNDPRAWARRLLMDTYRTFGCEDGRPTYRYTLLNAVQHDPPYLCNPETLDARTEITTQMLSDNGYTITRPADEDGQETEICLPAEALEQMARLAWRNNARCIGRLFWESLHLLDARTAGHPDEVFEACVRHLEYATNGGRIRPAVTVFAPADPGEKGIRLWNTQLIRYAGYGAADGSVLGDPDQAAFTARVMELGWQPPRDRSAFDLLPLVVDFPGHAPRWFELPRHAVLEVPISHPGFAWFADLGLKWHAVPAVSDRALVGGGHRFTAAPFSGYYMGTEIASRNFGDERRYHLLPLIAQRMGLDRSKRSLLWKDRALVEINTAVLHSFQKAGVVIVDHHTASTQFMQHVAKEEKCGRKVPGDWSWLVPPMSGSACPVFHRYYDDARPEPAYIEQERPW